MLGSGSLPFQGLCEHPQQPVQILAIVVEKGIEKNSFPVIFPASNIATVSPLKPSFDPEKE